MPNLFSFTAPTVPVFLPATLLRLLDGMGVDANRALADTGLSVEQINHPDARLSCEQFSVMMANALEASRQPALGLLFGEHIRLSRMGVLGYALMAAPSLREAIKVSQKYQKTMGFGLDLGASIQRNVAEISVAVSHRALIDESVYRFMMESWVMGVVRTLIDLTESSVQVESIAFDYAPPAHAAVYAERFGMPVRFEASACCVQFDASAIDAALPGSSPEAFAKAIALCEDWLRDSGCTVDIVDEVTACLLRDPADMPDASEVAKFLNMSQRTLQRRLAEQGLTYRELVQKTRQQIACEYLRHTNRPLTDIAQSLGFSDAANFSNAFSQWVGQTPMNFRRSSRSSVGTAA